MLVRRLNDHHIFVSQAIPLLQKARARLKESSSHPERTFQVPSTLKKAIARRTDAELNTLYGAFLDRDLFGTLLIAVVSLMESYILDVLRLVIQAHPGKLGISIQGSEGSRNVPLPTILQASSLDSLIEELIETRLVSISYASPRDYLTFLKEVTGVDTGEALFDQYIEIKATRDILVHNSGKVNALYLSKAGKLARAKQSMLLPVTSAYFDQSIATLKKMAVIISDGIRETFAERDCDEHDEKDD